MISVATLSIPQHRLSEAACVKLLLYLFFKQVQLKKKKKKGVLWFQLLNAVPHQMHL